MSVGLALLLVGALTALFAGARAGYARASYRLQLRREAATWRRMRTRANTPTHRSARWLRW